MEEKESEWEPNASGRNGQKKESIPLPLLQRNLGSSLAVGNLVCARQLQGRGRPLVVDLDLVGIRPLTCSSSLTELELLPKLNPDRRGSDKWLAGAWFGSDLDR